MTPYTLVNSRNIVEIGSTAKLYIHNKTGARIVSVTNNDENKVFSITFRTPPATSNGIAHIMEHSVLSGSRKYPVKEPFTELAKSSLKTFLNAFTAPDKTFYPVATTNLKDLYNLIDVYLDAVFYPLLLERTLQQEGWHYELESPDGPLTFKGVVFNEMKGNYSAPDMLINYEYSQRSLFPDNAYGLDSGGDPQVIPDLTYAEYKSFHQRYYHPSNAYIWFYGDDPEEERLRYLDTWLQAFDRAEVDSLVAPQPAWDQPRRLEYRYDSANLEAPKAYISLNWLLPENQDVQLNLGLSILSHILTATPASPLRKALMDSGLGEDLIGAGLDDSLRQMFYSTGMKGVVADNLDKVENLILETLHSLATQGIDPDTVAASLNTIEFRLREQNTGRFPRGLFMMMNAASTWMYGGDPLEALAFEAPLNAIRGEIDQGRRYFEGLIQKYLLDNPHRATVTMLPDAEEGKRRVEIENQRLQTAFSGMTVDQLQKVKEIAEALKRHQDTPDSPEALATIPSLQLSDIDRQVKTIPIAIQQAGGAQVFYHDLFTNGIVYLDLGFDLHSVPQEQLPFIGLFGRLLLQMGTERQDYVKLTQRIGRSTGGITSTVLATTVHQKPQSALWFFLRGKATVSQAPELLAILQEVLLTGRLDNRERFKQIVSEEKARLEAGLVPGGHAVVNRRLRAHMNDADWVSEQTSGIDYLHFLRSLLEAIDQDWPGVVVRLENVRKALINRASLVANATLDGANWQVLQPQLVEFLQALPRFDPQPATFDRPHSVLNEGLVIPAQVNYVGKGANLYSLGYQLHGSIHVIHHYLGSTWLWEKVRVQGGAYGGMSFFDYNSGVYSFLSYRDPNLLATLNTYDQTANFLRKLELSPSELTKTIIGTISELEVYLLPDAKGFTSMVRYLTNYSDDIRQRVYEEVLGTTGQDFKAFAEPLARLAEQGEVVVLGSAEAIEKANQEKAGFLDVKKVL
jgi:Zn-dependent M16 (insulinase) family peptidase